LEQGQKKKVINLDEENIAKISSFTAREWGVLHGILRIKSEQSHSQTVVAGSRPHTHSHMSCVPMVLEWWILDTSFNSPGCV